MSASQRELREAFTSGWITRARCDQENRVHCVSIAASEAYPPKLVTRPREALTLGNRWRLRNGVLEVSYCGQPWYPHAASAVILDLVANPTETVEVDE